MFLFDTPGAPRPRTLRLLLPRGKSNQKRARTNGSGLLSRGRLFGGQPRRGSKGLCGGGSGEAKPPNLQYFFSRSGACRSPPAGLSKGYCLQGALVLTGPACKFAPSPPDPRAECREATSTFDRTVRRSTDRHRPRARTIDRKSIGRSVNNIPRN